MRANEAGIYQNYIREARLERGLTQRELAEKIGIDQGHVSQYETNINNPCEENAKKISRILGLPLGVILPEGREELEIPHGINLRYFEKRMKPKQENREIYPELYDAVEKLRGDIRFVITNLFGLYGEPKTALQVRREYISPRGKKGISRIRVYQLRENGLKKLKRILERVR